MNPLQSEPSLDVHTDSDLCCSSKLLMRTAIAKVARLRTPSDVRRQMPAISMAPATKHSCAQVCAASVVQFILQALPTLQRALSTQQHTKTTPWKRETEAKLLQKDVDWYGRIVGTTELNSRRKRRSAFSPGANRYRAPASDL